MNDEIPILNKGMQVGTGTLAIEAIKDGLKGENIKTVAVIGTFTDSKFIEELRAIASSKNIQIIMCKSPEFVPPKLLENNNMLVIDYVDEIKPIEFKKMSALIDPKLFEQSPAVKNNFSYKLQKGRWRK